MEYGMVSVLIPREYEEVFLSCSKGPMQDAANALQWNLYYGFCKNLGYNISLFNLVPCGSFPQYYSKPFIPAFSFADKGKNLSFCNVKIVRNYFKTRSLVKALKNWCKSNDEEKTLFVYTISHSVIGAVEKIKKQYPALRVCAIVADLPDMSNLSSNQSFMLRLFSAKQAKDSYSLLSCVDSFVLLTRHMADYMNISQPFCVMEGIASEVAELNDNQTMVTDNLENKIVLYTGTLHRKFGILHLLAAFEKVSSEDIRLVICGTGDSEKEILKAANKDKRIDFPGQLRREEALALQRKATVLVNPRLNNEDFTKYSFPSKTMEYLASGVPVIAYKLDGIPDEYNSYITYPKDDTADSLAESIEYMCNLSDDTRKQIGVAGKEYVLKNKNAIAQTQRILNFLDSAHK